MKNNKILFITPGYYPVTNEYGGAIEGLADLFLQHNNRTHKYDITVYSAFSDEAKKDKDIYKNTHFRPIRIDSFKYKIMSKMHAISRRIIPTTYQRRYARLVIKDLVRRGELSGYYDIVVVDNSIKELLYYRKKIGKTSRLILHLHNDLLFPEVDKAKRILDSLDEVWCCSKYIAARVDSIDTTSKKTKVLYNTTRIYDSMVRAKKEKNSNEKFVIFYSGRIMKEKGVIELVEAYNSFHKKHPESSLIIVGGAKNLYKIDDYYNNILQLTRNRDDILIKYNIKQNELLKLYSSVDIQVVPSIWNEAFGITALEGALSATPVIFSNKGGLPEIFSDHRFMIKEVTKKTLFEKLNEAFNDRSSLKQFVNKERDNAKKFSKENYCACFDRYVEEAKK